MVVASRRWTLVSRDYSNKGSNVVTVFVKPKIVKCPCVL